MSKIKTIWQISVEIPLESEDAVLELFNRMFGEQSNPSAWQLHESNRTKVSIYTSELQAPPLNIKANLKKELNLLKDLGLDISSPKISIRQIKEEDWAESWKKHFKVLTFDKKLMIAPSWSKRNPSKGMVKLILDPGLSFGTGHHPTTSYCLSQIVEYSPEKNQKKSMLDIGCGTGILSIAAAALGYSPIFGFDNDPEAAKNSIKNAAINHYESLIDFQILGIETMDKFPNNWDLVCANLEAPLLIEFAQKISFKVTQQGKLIIAGILNHQFEDVVKTYTEYGITLIKNINEGEWTSGTLIKINNK